MQYEHIIEIDKVLMFFVNCVDASRQCERTLSVMTDLALKETEKSNNKLVPYVRPITHHCLILVKS